MNKRFQLAALAIFVLGLTVGTYLVTRPKPVALSLTIEAPNSDASTPRRLDASTPPGVPLPPEPWNRLRWRHLACYLGSGLRSTPQGERLESIASQHGLPPDGLMDAWRLAWMRRNLERDDEGWQAIRDMIYTGYSIQMRRLYPGLAQEFFDDLADWPADIAPPACGSAEAEMDIDVTDPELYPGFELGPRWFQANAVHHESRLQRFGAIVDQSEFLATSEGAAVEKAFDALKSDAGDRPLMLQTAFEHVQTLEQLRQQRAEAEELISTQAARLGLDPAIPSDASNPALAAARLELTFFEQQAEAFRTHIQTVWTVVWGDNGTVSQVILSSEDGR